MLLGLRTRGSSWVRWKTEGWKSFARWCASSTGLKVAAQALSSPQGGGEGDYAFPLLPWPHLLEITLLSPLISGVQIPGVGAPHATKLGTPAIPGWGRQHLQLYPHRCGQFSVRIPQPGLI